MPNDLRPEFFRRLDDSDDESFYLIPRLVVHIDDAAIKKVGDIYREHLPRGGAILDLMSSWRSHLPPELKPSRVVGLGLNRPEMADNPALTEIVTHNLNRLPQMPFEDAYFDLVISNGVLNLIPDKQTAFKEIARILRPKGALIAADLVVIETIPPEVLASTDAWST